MSRIDAAIAPADDTLFREHQPISAVVTLATLQDGKSSAHADARLADMREGADKLAEKTARGTESVHVDLSSAGKAMAAGGQIGRANRNADIEESDLPDQIKDLLKRIRQIREEIAQKQAELRAAMADTRMRPEQRKMKVAMLQAEVMALSAALVLASNTMSRLIGELKLSDEQAMLAGQLMMA